MLRFAITAVIAISSPMFGADKLYDCLKPLQSKWGALMKADMKAHPGAFNSGRFQLGLRNSCGPIGKTECKAEIQVCLAIEDTGKFSACKRRVYNKSSFKQDDLYWYDRRACRSDKQCDDEMFAARRACEDSIR